ncbi:MAG: glycosyltransferase family 39 protein [Candidatus Eisenbacteria bacterium]|nr:glycosyltransferase family 39 protein [Candidatus Eisenbacteria bacterium]
MKRRLYASILLIFLIALFLRVLFLVHLHPHPYFDNLMIDSASYDRWAGRIASGDFRGDGVFYQSPLYPYFLGGLYALFGRDLTAVRLAQAILGSITCVLLFLLARRAFSSAAGYAAGLLAAAYATFLFQDLMLLKSVVIFFFTALAFLRLQRWTTDENRFTLAQGGFLLGVAVCGRGNLLFPAGAILLWILARERRPLSGAALRNGSLFLLGLAIAVAPVTVRNRVVGGDWVLTESDAGINVFVGNNPAATGIHTPPASIRTVPEHEEEDARRFAESRMGRPLHPSEVSRFWISGALRFIRSDPAAWSRLVLRKALLAWNGYEVPDNYDQQYFARVSPLFHGWLLSFHILAPLGLLGMVLTLRRWRTVGFLHAYTLAYFVSLLLLYVTSRYRLPMALGLVPLSGYGAARTAAAIRRKEWRFLLPVLPSLLILFALTHVPLFPYRGFVKQETEIATFYANRGNTAAAEDAFRRAIAEGSGSGMLHLVYLNQGFFYRDLGRTTEAEAAFRNALRENPSFRPARLELEKLLAGEDRDR